MNVDVLIVGGSFAGLAAAMQLDRGQSFYCKAKPEASP